MPRSVDLQTPPGRVANPGETGTATRDADRASPPPGGHSGSAQRAVVRRGPGHPGLAATWFGPRRGGRRLLRGGWLWALALWATLASCAWAGDLDREAVVRRFPPPFKVGEKLKDIPAWPLASELEPEAGPVAYVFESVDLAPIPGFEGTPMNLLVAIDRKGDFIDVEVLRQHEPVFLGGLGEAPFQAFVRQYAGKGLRQEIAVSSTYGDTRSGGGGNRVVLDGVAKATASVRIANQTVLSAAHAVARAKLGFAAPSSRPAATVRPEAFQALDVGALLAGGYVARLEVSNAEAERLFAGTDGEGADPDAAARPGDRLVTLYIAYLNAPTIGRALLGDARHGDLMSKLEPGQHAFWIASAGRYPIVDERFVPGTSPPRLALAQDGLPIEIRDLVFDLPAPPAGLEVDVARVFRVHAHAGLDPGRPTELALTVTRAKGMILPRITHRSVTLRHAPPERLFDYPPRPLPDWLLAWVGRWPDLAIIGGALAVLTWVLARPRAVTASRRRLSSFRTGFAVFTLAFVGWHAQGQLSIVQVTGAIKTLVSGQGLASFLYDPVSLLLIAFTTATFFVWGRGTFCGWLCPFGALQELVAVASRRLRLPQWRPSEHWRVLRHLRFVLLALLAGAAVTAPRLAESLVEVEPFKTAITVGFDRSWPYVAYAVLVLLAGAFCYKFFCRFVCPLGAAMELGGRLRRRDWLARRAECGRPCQTCRHRCDYEAIDRDGRIRYADCFQCLDCVSIYHDETRCAPLVLYRAKGRRVDPRTGRVAREPAGLG
ncbi:MAG: 4Fe-4S binding protein [Rhodocyclaceae bacterium]|nr:4Fe-4S binding protein [Rhodocyclaceae bacterium]